MARDTRQRQGIIKFLGNIVDESKNMVDDLLDRAHDVERDLRSTVRRALDTDEGDDDVPEVDFSSLQAALAELSAKVDQLAIDQGHAHRGSEDGEPAKP
ncbi:hypothetical protein [Nocardia sp. NRRL S-836]|uniref:hypothetical protein n=1 Tax=Nocardia sp. NRRL S-836 TaxID=1519492 RepID=UPI0006AE7881|nr:hypothetical protein [Nocardia sp. NRRL S-836]KOV83457.1 hypothetical protein ADL03_20480 [Nocardia sp. NRRL S-836]